jgi:hypothetical protein
MSQADVWDQAKQGNAKAIAVLMNQQLQPKGIRAKAMNEQEHLKIIFEARVVPPEKPLVAFTKRGLAKLGVTAIDQVMIYGKQANSDFPGWQHEFILQTPSQVAAVPDLSQTTVPRPPVSSSSAAQMLSQPIIGAGSAAPEWESPFTPESVTTVFTLFTVFWWLGFAFLLLDQAVQIGLFLLFAAVVCLCIAFFRHSTLLQGHGTKIEPTKAVGFSFVPVFCFYWWFVAFAGLSKDTNRYMERHNIPWPRMNYKLSLLLCLFACIWVGSAILTKNLDLSMLGSAVEAAKDTVSYLISRFIGIPILIIGFLIEENRKNCVLAIINYRQLYGNTTIPENLIERIR